MNITHSARVAVGFGTFEEVRREMNNAFGKIPENAQFSGIDASDSEDVTIGFYWIDQA